MVGMAGLEPARCYHQRILSPLRLPIPPHPLIKNGGSYRGRTGARRVAVCCLTTWLRNRIKLHYHYRQAFLKMQLN